MRKLPIFLLCVACASAAYGQSKIEFNVSPKTLDKALIEFAQQADITLLFPYDTTKQEQSSELNGKYTINLGLVKLLEESSFFPVANQDGTFSIRPIVKPSLVDKSVNTAAPINTSIQDYSDPTFERIAIVGSRSVPRSVLDSSVPLDILSRDQFRRQGSTDINDIISTLVPSFNVTDQLINDAASFVRPANFRGLASDHTLVLMNGKRRHRSAVITFLSGGLSDGAQGPDIANIPVSALKQIEVLRDGAAAQYGSDAIAGVINFVLNDSDSGGSFEAKVGQFSQGDGELTQLQGNIGLSLLHQGFVNISAEYQQQQGTNRSVQRDDAALSRAAGNLAIPEVTQIWGQPQLKDDVKFLVNVGLPVSDTNTLYGFANLAKRRPQSDFFYRHPQVRTGVFVTEPNDFGQSQLLVADLDGLNQGIECPLVPILDANVLDDPAFLLISGNDEVGTNCFAFSEILPGGFRPRFSAQIKDLSLTLGAKGQLFNEWLYDVSWSLGKSDISYFLDESINPSLGATSPTSFRPGSAKQEEQGVNLDITKSFDVGLFEPLNLAVGFEWRSDSYSQIAGDESSFEIGPLAFNEITEDFQGFGIGSNGFPGFRPESAGTWNRENIALYADIELPLLPFWRLETAFRYENFTDFGATFNGKLSSHLSINDSLAFRGAISSGFKAPTVGQSNVINVTTTIGPQGLEDQATLPPTNLISQQLGATPLTPEKSVNYSFGVVGTLSPNVFFTLDYFNIVLNDRISTTSAIPIQDNDIQVLLDQGVAAATSFGSVRFFTNDFDTRTQGIDIVASYTPTNWLTNTEFTLTYNWTDTQVDRVTLNERVTDNGEVLLEANLTPQRIRMIEENTPSHRFSVTAVNQYKQLNSLIKLNYFSSFYEDHLNASAGLDIESGSEYTLDVEFDYAISSIFNLAVGATNILNNVPDDNPFSGVAGAPFPLTSPIGINGGFFYARARYQF